MLVVTNEKKQMPASHRRSTGQAKRRRASRFRERASCRGGGFFESKMRPTDAPTSRRSHHQSHPSQQGRLVIPQPTSLSSHRTVP